MRRASGLLYGYRELPGGLGERGFLLEVECWDASFASPI